MRIAICYRYFYPDTPPYAKMLHDISGWLAEEGHEVTVLTAQPSYKPAAGISRQPWREQISGFSVVRLPLLPERGAGLVRIINSGLFLLFSFVYLLFARRFDLIWTATMPPVLQGALLRLVARLRGAAFLYHMQDIYPEIGMANDVIKPGRMSRWMKRLDMSTIRRSQSVVVLSEDMKDALRDRGLPVDNVSVINNYSLVDADTFPAGKPAADRAVKRFVFAGNIGRFQNLNALVDAFGRIGSDVATLELLGDGRLKPELQALVASKGYDNVHFHGHIDADAAFEFIRNCDVAVVSLQPGLYRFAYPSKVLTYLAAGIPILALVEEESELARTIRDRHAGQVAPWSLTDNEFERAILDMCRKGDDKARENVEDLYSPAAARSRWVRLLKGLEKEK